MTTSTHRELDDWLREGRPEPMSDVLSRHLDACSECRAALDEVDEVRAWFPDETPEITPDAAAAIRFRLQAEARTRAATRGHDADRPVAATRATTSRFWLFAAAAAAVAVLTVGGVAGALVWLGSESGHSEVTHVSSRNAASPDVPADRRHRHETRSSAPDVTPRPSTTNAPALDPPAPAPIAPAAPAPPSVSGDAPSATVPASPDEHRATASRVRRPAVNLPERVDVQGIDRAFHEAWQLRRAGRNDEAARAFDALLARRGLGARRADVLYWSARAHEASGRRHVAVQRLEKLVRSHPRAWHAAEGRRRLEAMRPE